MQGAFAILNEAMTASEGADESLSHAILDRGSVPTCGGTRLNPRARARQVSGKGIWEVSALSAADCLEHLTSLPLNARDTMIAEPILKEIVPRLSFLKEVGCRI